MCVCVCVWRGVCVCGVVWVCVGVSVGGGSGGGGRVGGVGVGGVVRVEGGEGRGGGGRGGMARFAAASALMADHVPVMALNLDMGGHDFCEIEEENGPAPCGLLTRNGMGRMSNVLRLAPTQ